MTSLAPSRSPDIWSATPRTWVTPDRPSTSFVPSVTSMPSRRSRTASAGSVSSATRAEPASARADDRRIATGGQRPGPVEALGRELVAARPEHEVAVVVDAPVPRRVSSAEPGNARANQRSPSSIRLVASQNGTSAVASRSARAISSCTSSQSSAPSMSGYVGSTSSMAAARSCPRIRVRACSAVATSDSAVERSMCGSLR